MSAADHLVMVVLSHTVISFSGSAYTEPFPMNPVSAGQSADEDHGRTSEEEEGGAEQSYDRQVNKLVQQKCSYQFNLVSLM